jgi:4-coumarate--CoA ligase
MTGFSQVIFSSLMLEKRLITSTLFSCDLCFDLIEKYSLTRVFLLPPHIVLLTESKRFPDADLSSLKVFSTGGMFVTEHLRRKLQSRLANGNVVVAYGMTELGGILTSTEVDDAISSTVSRNNFFLRDFENKIAIIKKFF